MFNTVSSCRSVAIGRALAASCFLTLTSMAFGQVARPNDIVSTPGLKIDASVGWDSTVSQTAPLAVSFLIENQSTDTIEGTLSLHDPVTGHTADLGEVFSGPVSTRRLSSVQDLSDWSRCVATLRSGRRVLWRRELILMTGREFYDDHNYTLFVDDKFRSFRRLAFAGGLSHRAAPANTVGLTGQSAACLSAPAWQLPTHPGPLVVVQAIVLPDDFDFTNLNDGQWQAIAEWVCLGGTVFLHRDSTEHLAQISEMAPLDTGSPNTDDLFSIRRLGLGTIATYEARLFSAAGAAVQEAIAERISRLPNQYLSTMPLDITYDYRQTDGSTQNGLLVASFFGGYTLLSGLVVLAMFRRTRRQIAIWTVGVVVLASVCAGALGAVLRMSRGDLNWTTVTMAGEGGIVQVGRIELKSAGGRDNRVAVHGAHPDLQFTGTPSEVDRFYYYSGSRPKATQAFTWQPSVLQNDESRYQINVPMTPWGRRQAQVTDFDRGVPQMELKLQYRSRTGGNGHPSDGEFEFRMVNHLPFDVADCQLVICAAHERLEAPETTSNISTNSNAYPGGYMSYDNSPSGYSHRILRLQRVTSGATYENIFEADFVESNDEWNGPLSQLPGRLPAPRLPQPGTVRAWIMGHLNHSPILEIDESATEFMKRSSSHWFVQEVRSEDIMNTNGIIEDLTDTVEWLRNEKSKGARTIPLQ